MSLYNRMLNLVDSGLARKKVENRHGNTSIHNVPQETIEKMKTRFQIKL